MGCCVAFPTNAGTKLHAALIDRVEALRHVLWRAGDAMHWIRIVPSKMTGRRISAVVR